MKIIGTIIFRKYKYLYSKMKNIFNANSDAKNYIDVFPKVEFDTLFPNQTPSNNLKSD